MKGSKRTIAVLLALTVLVALSTPLYAGGQGEGEETPYIAVISKGFQHDFWQQVRIGSEDAAEEFNVDITFEGPPSESDVQDQVQMLNNALAKDPVAIALAALDTNAVIDQLEQARDGGIPVVGFDSGVPDAPEGSIVANASTNNYAAAGTAAEKMFEEIRGDIEDADASDPVTVVVMNQDASGESLLSRGFGFRDRMVELILENTDHGEDDILVDGNDAYVADDSPQSDDPAVTVFMVVPASASAQDTTSAANAVLDRVDDDSILGIFCSNEATVKGLLAATDDGAELGDEYDDLVVIGYDAGAGQKNAVREGYFLGSITQDPRQIGYKAVELAYKAYQGESVSDVDTGAKFYTAENMDDPDIAPLLYD
ncbi:MAG: ABC transporter substrate-binding protein [Spirochaetaceae bacterium]